VASILLPMCITHTYGSFVGLSTGNVAGWYPIRQHRRQSVGRICDRRSQFTWHEICTHIHTYTYVRTYGGERCQIPPRSPTGGGGGIKTRTSPDSTICLHLWSCQVLAHNQFKRFQVHKINCVTTFSKFGPVGHYQQLCHAFIIRFNRRCLSNFELLA